MLSAFSACRRILCLGAHSDDIEIGCGGTLLTLLARRKDLVVRWVVFSATPDRATEATTSAADFLGSDAHVDVRIGSFRDSYFPAQWSEIKTWFADLKSEFEPDIVLTHFREDRHQDHRVISDLTWNAFRNQLVLEYEVPKWDGDLGHPNCYVPAAPDVVDRKVALLMRHFKTQHNKHWFDEELFRGMMRIRGAECGHRYAEAFHARKFVLG